MIQIKVGSAPSNNVVLNHPSVSPFHLEFVQDDNGNFLLSDLNSQYGTTVNGYRVQGMVQLRQTDIVKAGELVLPWTNYFIYQNPVNPPVSTLPPFAHMPQNTPYTNPISQPPVPPKPKNKKKIALIIGGSILAIILGIVGLIYFYTRPSFEHLKLIPSNALFVASIDFKSIASKIDLEKMQRLEFFTDMKDNAKDKNDAVSKVMADPMSSGIDIFSQPYAFMIAENQEYMRFTGGVVFALKNKNDFERFIGKLNRENTIQHSENFQYLNLNEGSCIVWNNKSGIILYSDKSESRRENYLKNLFDQDEKDCILSNSTFSTFSKTKFDIGIFVNYDALHVIPNFVLPASLRGTSAMVNIDFNDGKLSYASELLTSGTMDEQGMFLGKKGVSNDLKSSIPGKSFGVASMSLNMNALYNYLDKDPNMSSALDEIARNLKIERTKLSTILSGEFFACMPDFKPMVISKMRYNYLEETGNYEYVEQSDTTLMPTYLIGAAVKDIATIENAFGKMYAIDTINGIRYWTTYNQGNNYLAHNGVNYYFTNDFTLAESVTNGKATEQVSGNMANLISADPLYSYFNLNLSKYPVALPEFLENNMGHSDFKDFKTFFGMLDYAELSGDGVKQVMDINFVDKGNCLNTILKTGNELYLNHNHH